MPQRNQRKNKGYLINANGGGKSWEKKRMTEEVKTEVTETVESKETGFKPIETQEALNAIIKDRIDRAKKSVHEQFAGYDEYKAKAEKYDSELAKFNKTLSGKETELKELRTKVQQYETDSVKKGIADEYGLKPGMEKFLTGSDEKAWRSAAEELSAYTKTPYPRPSTTEPTTGTTLEQTMAKQFRNLSN